jgi:hypothetical protein
MLSDPDLLTLAHSVFCKKWDCARDSRGEPAEKVSQATPSLGTAKIVEHQGDTLGVPLSHVLGHGTVGQREKPEAALGTVAGWSPYSAIAAALESECPVAVETRRWRQAIADAAAFLATWGAQAHAFGWTARELFGLHAPPKPAPANYSRLSRYDETGLVWILRSRQVIALTKTTAAIRGATAVLTYRKLNKPSLGPLGDSLDDFDNCKVEHPAP